MSDSKPIPMTPFVGTERLRRPLTDAENKELGAMLRAHDFVGASSVALRFAYKLTHSKERAKDLRSRAYVRLIRFGWDPEEVKLVKRLCRLVWSEWTNEKSETAAARRAEEMFLEQERADGRSTPEDRAAEQQRRLDTEALDDASIESLRASFREAKDEVNLLWLEYRLQDIEEPAEMARRSGREVMEFYRATNRRDRHIVRLLAAQRGVKDNEEDA